MARCQRIPFAKERRMLRKLLEHPEFHRVVSAWRGPDGDGSPAREAISEATKRQTTAVIRRAIVGQGSCSRVQRHAILSAAGTPLVVDLRGVSKGHFYTHVFHAARTLGLTILEDKRC
jgi:hypothetical protein